MKNNLLLLFGLLLYRVTLDAAYPVISKYYVCSGMIITDKAMPWILSWAIFLYSIPMIVKLWNKNTPYSIIICTLYLCGFVPVTSLFMYIDPAPGFVYTFLLYWSVLLFASLLIPDIKIPEIKYNRDYSIFLYAFALLIGAGVLYTSWRVRGLSFHFDLSTVYELRRDANLMNMNGMQKRLLALANKTLPIITVYFLWRKKWGWFIGLFIISLLNFGIAGHKTVLFTIILSLTFYWGYRDWMWKYIPAALAFLNFAGIFLLDCFGIIELISYSTRRIFFLPPLLNYCYYDYFNTKGPDYYLSGIVGKIVKIPSEHAQDISHTIGEIYFNAPQMGANNGLYSDAFANLGATGCIILPLLLCFCIFMLQYFGRNLPIKVLFSVVIVYSITFISSFLPTIFLTHGLAIVYILFCLMSSAKKGGTAVQYEQCK